LGGKERLTDVFQEYKKGDMSVAVKDETLALKTTQRKEREIER